jgi:fructose-bisphosphate aldolase class II
VHGKYGPKGPQLQYDRLQNIRDSTKGRVELVLHGAGAEWYGTDDGKLLQKNISHGISKCNINDIINDPYREYLAKHAETKGLTGLIEGATDIMQKETEKCMDWMRSSGKASSVKLS